PAPQAGKDGVSPLAADVAAVVLEDVRTAALEAVAGLVAAIPAPKDGKDADMGAVRAMVEAEVAAEVAKIPPARDGKDGTNVTLADVAPLVRELVDAMPKPKDGRDGRDGASVSLADVEPVLRDMVAA